MTSVGSVDVGHTPVDLNAVLRGVLEDLAADVGYQPSTTVEEGVRKFVDWYLEYYGS